MQSNLDPGMNVQSRQSFGGSSGYGSVLRAQRNTADSNNGTVDHIQGSGMTGAAVQVPSASASVAERLEFLHSRLDTLSNTDFLMDRFVLLGHSHRLQGGMGSCVQCSVQLSSNPVHRILVLLAAESSAEPWPPDYGHLEASSAHSVEFMFIVVCYSAEVYHTTAQSHGRHWKAGL